MTSCPGPNVERHQRQQQGVGTGGDADAKCALAVGSDVLLKLRDLSPENESLAGADLFDGRQRLGLERGVLRLQVQQRYLHRGVGLAVDSARNILIESAANLRTMSHSRTQAETLTRHALLSRSTSDVVGERGINRVCQPRPEALK